MENQRQMAEVGRKAAGLRLHRYDGSTGSKIKQQQRQDFGRMRVSEFASISCLIPQTRQNKRPNLTCFKECWKSGGCATPRLPATARTNSVGQQQTTWFELQLNLTVQNQQQFFNQLKHFYVVGQVVPTSTYSSNTDLFPSSGECQNQLQAKHACKGALLPTDVSSAFCHFLHVPDSTAI